MKCEEEPEASARDKSHMLHHSRSHKALRYYNNEEKKIVVNMVSKITM